MPATALPRGIALGLPPLIEAARSQGVAALAIRNSYNCGALGYHTERIAQAGLVGLGFTNAPASIAPWGGRKAAVGTNPLSLAVPDGQAARASSSTRAQASSPRARSSSALAPANRSRPAGPSMRAARRRPTQAKR
ncbi:Ldh family oxidoreductase [Mesorhizobium sp. M2A.F.Ca.ET.043.02.1.1]|uniref:Ldh family oxidoreductase n=1 Tax=Mesorhizobium sp. M2A.F.Ca.ET.043.02.1.1 TaxID=2493670 RepID=UPI001AECAD57|nr:Ldh family oxidoreductase [Mesorhizobium sp. M2A.F.Ca.ET.043.02.1.1]